VATKKGKVTKNAPEKLVQPTTYADGTPLDEVQYLEAKLILKPDHFTSVDSFREFGKLVQRTAKKMGIGYVEDKATRKDPEVREIVFYDTPDFRLYNNAHILRRRIAYVDGFPVGDPEIVFKFRHPDAAKATAVDVRPQIDGKYRVKFKAELLPLKEKVGGYRILYSHNSQFGLSQAHEKDKASMLTLSRAFPPIAKLKKSDTERVGLVNNGIVEELLLPMGQLDFGKGIVADTDVSLWRTRGEHKPLVGEYSFGVKFASKEALAAKQRKLVLKFHLALQKDLKDWLQLGVTKTAMVYRLNGNGPQIHE
jgi:hypothetical protein